MEHKSTDRLPATERVGCMLRALYEASDAEERRILDFIFRQAVEHLATQTDADEYSARSVVSLGARPGTREGMKRVLFRAADVTGDLGTPGVINRLVASARDADLFG